MKLKDIICALFMSSTFITGFAAMPTAQSAADKDNSVLNAKIEMLNIKKSRIENRITEEDSKRNAVHNGVSAETIENMNREQDSICLVLRSQLVDVNLEIAEIKKGKLSTLISNSITATK